jgi:lipoyl(octanoyl) transferase
VPCGIDDKAVTSLAHEVGHQVKMDVVKSLMKEKMASLFNLQFFNV